MCRYDLRCHRALRWVLLTAGAHPSTCHWVGMLKGSSFFRHRGWNCSVNWGPFWHILTKRCWGKMNHDESMQFNKMMVIIVQAKNRHFLDLEHFRRNWPCQDWRSAEHRYIDVSWCIRHDSSQMNKSAKQNGVNPYSLIDFYSATRLGYNLPITYSR